MAVKRYRNALIYHDFSLRTGGFSVENGRFLPGDPVAEIVVGEYLSPLKEAGVDTLVLGCTHFAFLRAPLEAVVPGVAVLDGVAPVLRRVRDALARADALCEAGEGSVEVLSSSEDAAVLARMRALLAAPAR